MDNVVLNFSFEKHKILRKLDLDHR